MLEEPVMSICVSPAGIRWLLPTMEQMGPIGKSTLMGSWSLPTLTLDQILLQILISYLVKRLMMCLWTALWPMCKYLASTSTKAMWPAYFLILQTMNFQGQLQDIRQILRRVVRQELRQVQFLLTQNSLFLRDLDWANQASRSLVGPMAIPIINRVLTTQVVLFTTLLLLQLGFQRAWPLKP